MNKKYILILLMAGALSSCSQSNAIEFDVTAPGLNHAVFVVKDEGQQTVFGENIKDGKCTVKGILDHPGFYQFDIIKDGDEKHVPFEVYLEPVKYSITADANKLNQYPKIETDSKKQQEINNYNALYEELGGTIREQTVKLNKEFEAKSHTLSVDASKQLLIKISASEDKEHNIEYNVLEQYIKKYPQSELAAHFMMRQNYGDEPEDYLKLYNQLSAAAKNSDDGKEIIQKLNVAANLQPGKKAPDIAGKTFDGKPFSTVTAGKKLFLIDFWRSANQFSRTNHEKIIGIYADLSKKGFQVISVSMDSKPLWWKTAVKDDKLPWPQISDLKGNDSPNATNWDITTIPTYYLVDADWKIYKKDISLSSIELEASQYLEKHR